MSQARSSDSQRDPGGARKALFARRGARALAGIVALVSSLAAVPAWADGPCQSPAERALGKGPLELSVGYVDEAPLAWDAEAGAREPVGVAVDVLRSLASRNGWRLRFAPYDAADVIAHVADCTLDLGITPLRRSPSVVDQTIPYFRTVAAVVRRTAPGTAVHDDDDHQAVSSRPTGAAGAWAARVLRALFFGALALGGLMLLVNLVNLRVPRPEGRLPERLRLVALDPRVAGARGAWRWLSSAAAGRILALVWLATGIAIAVASAPPAGAGARSGQDATYASALRQSLNVSQAIGVRPGGQQVRCPDVERCLEDLAHGDLAALAGESETICHDVRVNHLASVRFEPNLLGPRDHAFLVPPSGALRRLVNAALAQATAGDADLLAPIWRKYGIPWTAPVIASECPTGRDVRW